MHPVDKKIWEKFHIKPHDTLPFSPWLGDANRNHIAELFGELQFNVGAEIGVRMGRFSQVFLEANKNLKMYCIDPWAPYARVSQDKQDRFYRHCERRLKGYNAALMKMTSMTALDEFEDESLDFVYIDGRHEFDFVIQDIIGWNAKVKKGGIVAGHDYYFFYSGGVTNAVDAYTKAHNINCWYITREREPSWFWVKK